MDVFDADEAPNGFCTLFIIPGQHDRGDVEGFQVFDAFDGVGLDGIGNGDAAEEGLAFCDVDVGADLFSGRDGTEMPERVRSFSFPI